MDSAADCLINSELSVYNRQTSCKSTDERLQMTNLKSVYIRRRAALSSIFYNKF
jgi:hypothetical protein